MPLLHKAVFQTVVSRCCLRSPSCELDLHSFKTPGRNLKSVFPGYFPSVVSVCFSEHINNSARNNFLSNQLLYQWSPVSRKSPTESDYGQAEEGAEGGVERLDLG